MTTKEKIQQILEAEFHPIKIAVVEDSAHHAGHREAQQSGGGHFSVLVVSMAFEGKKSIERHRMVYEALSPQMGINIHALAIKAYTPAEAIEISRN